MVAARRRSASSGPLRGLQRHVRRRARSCVQSNLPAMPTIGEGGLIPPISGQAPHSPSKSLEDAEISGLRRYLYIAAGGRPPARSCRGNPLDGVDSLAPNGQTLPTPPTGRTEAKSRKS